ncbi:molybdenum cofactor biosynthesis protein [Silvibacterium dinghuense]|uniref:Molybdopterin synthase catalytic subunit n=1 Tax=Silvibacterium dinghuense TaxID=1560006 RepID=A0A4Q1SEC2_9BACT|nr:molybdenum cofactor biosynthesis protein MoaE [Silvibacterium dinghuense]RXS95619.1 molybdopterin synthase [Silvibacterium dinghuense]GGH14456.1 molybdenum cofactor biosynthesis protein D/E [Silvibacterium dinghuense]
MRVRLLLFGVLKDLFPHSSGELEIAAGSTVADLLARWSMLPGSAQILPSLAVAVNQEYTGAEHILEDGDEVALLPPVSGGSEPGDVILLTRDRIDAQSLISGLKSGADGAITVFDGIVRNHTRGRQTLYLDYEAYEEMALSQMRALAAEARSRFGVRQVALVHRLGRLAIGETSVLIVAASAHRAAAFDACRWLIDTLKKTVPIWKKEYFTDGAVWADGDPFPEGIALHSTPPAGQS